MRLKHDNQSTIYSGTSGSDDRGNLRRVVAVVVDHHYTARLAAHLKSPLGPRKFAQCRSDAGEGHSRLESDRHRPERVQQVVAPRYAQPQMAEADGLAAGLLLE